MYKFLKTLLYAIFTDIKTGIIKRKVQLIAADEKVETAGPKTIRIFGYCVAPQWIDATENDESTGHVALEL